MAQSTRFWDRIAARYARRPVPDEAVYRKKLEITRSYFRPDMEVLEFGCGTGSTANAHAAHARHIRATDISGKMIAIAREKAESANVPNVTFEQADIDTLDVPDTSCDVVMGHSILHLVEDRDAVIAKVHAMLKPGGVFVTSTACIGDSMLRYLKPVAALGHLLGFLPLLRAFTTGELVDSLTHAGFEIDHQWQPGKNAAVFIVAKKKG